MPGRGNGRGRGNIPHFFRPTGAKAEPQEARGGGRFGGVSLAGQALCLLLEVLPTLNSPWLGFLDAAVCCMRFASGLVLGTALARGFGEGLGFVSWS